MKKYRKLKVGEKLQKNDFYFNSTGGINKTHYTGEPASCDSKNACSTAYYRPISENIPKKTSRIALMRLCESWGLTNDQYLMVKKHIYNNYRRRVR
jgi:hypothetical protein